MSIINNVLRELESKPSSFTPLDTLNIGIEKKQSKGYSSTFWAALFVLLAVLILSVSILNMDWFSDESHQVKLSQPLTDDRAGPDMDKEPVRTAEAFKPLRGLQFNEEPDFMSLEFELQDQSQIYLRQRSGNRYTFHLRKTLSGIQAPLLGKNPWLAELGLNNVEGGLDIHFETRQGVMVETSSLIKEEQFYWFVKLKKVKTKEPEQKLPFKNTAKVESLEPQLKSQVPSPELEQSILAPASRPLKLEIKSTTSQTTELHRLNAAIKSYTTGDWIEAEKELTELLDGNQDRQARLHLAHLFKQRKKQSQLIELLKESREKYSNDATFDLLYANQLFANKQYSGVISEFDSKTNNENILNLLAASYQRTDQHDKAILHYMEAIRLSPQQAKLWVSLGISQQVQGQSKQALHSFETALTSGPLNDRLKTFLQQRIRLLSGHRG